MVNTRKKPKKNNTSKKTNKKINKLDTEQKSDENINNLESQEQENSQKVIEEEHSVKKNNNLFAKMKNIIWF